MSRSSVAKSFRSDADRWEAVRRRDKRADGHFFYSVDSTGVFCRPSCPSRRPRRENVRFHDTSEDAEKHGFRPCKRCEPGSLSSPRDRRQCDAVSAACRRIAQSEETPDLRELARSVHWSPSHFHRVFKALTGLTPKAYAVAHRSARVRKALRRSRTVTSAIYGAGFNSNGRFYATSRKVLGMTPSAFRSGGKGMTIEFAISECSLGSLLVGATAGGICSIILGDDPDQLVQELKAQFPRASQVQAGREFKRSLARIVKWVERPAGPLALPLDIQGTAFQQRVWQKLSEIPLGETRTYAEVARDIGLPKAVRAVAAACAANRIAIAIPCHRVVRSGGALAGYRWGVERKARLLKAERESVGKARS